MNPLLSGDPSICLQLSFYKPEAIQWISINFNTADLHYKQDSEERVRTQELGTNRRI